MMIESVTTTDHSLYLWLAYGLALLVALWLYGWPILSHRRYLRQLKQQSHRQQNPPTPPSAESAQ